jgi:hypothetical protein
MNSTVNAHVAADAELLLDYLGAKGLDEAVPVNPGQAHLGGLIVDSVLQRRQRYASMVAPRVARLITVWPDADTTSGFRNRLDAPEDASNDGASLDPAAADADAPEDASNDGASLDPAAADAAASDQTGLPWLGGLGRVLNWYSFTRLVQMAQTAEVFHDHGIDTTTELREHLQNQDTRRPLHQALQAIHHLGPKTLDYLDILCGITPASAIGSRLRLATTRAGITVTDDGHLKAVVRHAATLRHWPVRDLDAVLWASHAS